MPAAVAGPRCSPVVLGAAPRRKASGCWPGLWQIVFRPRRVRRRSGRCRDRCSRPGAWYPRGRNSQIWHLQMPIIPCRRGAMAVPFGIGQLYVAAVLYRSNGAHDGKLTKAPGRFAYDGLDRVIHEKGAA